MIKYCKECLFPDTKPDLYFDKDGVCDACISAKRKHGKVQDDKIDWEKRKIELHNYLEKKINLDTPYDCVVPVSGGKDSTWQVYAAKNILNLRTLAVTFDQFDQTEVGAHNLNVLREIGVDHIHITMNPDIIRKLVKKGLDIIGDPYWVNHVGIFSIPVNIASKFSIPVILYGENPQFEYGGPEQSRENKILDKRWRQEFSGMRGVREEDMVDENISMDDLYLLRYPIETEIKKANVEAIFLGHFLKWDPIKHTEFVKTIGWKPLPKAPKGSWLDIENCDMKFIDIRERIKFLKYGYGRATDQLNIAIRLNKISRDHALSIVKKIDGKVDKNNLIDFANYLQIPTQKLVDIVNSYANRSIFEYVKNDFKEINERY